MEPQTKGDTEDVNRGCVCMGGWVGMFPHPYVSIYWD